MPRVPAWRRIPSSALPPLWWRRWQLSSDAVALLLLLLLPLPTSMWFAELRLDPAVVLAAPCRLISSELLWLVGRPALSSQLGGGAAPWSELMAGVLCALTSAAFCPALSHSTHGTHSEYWTLAPSCDRCAHLVSKTLGGTNRAWQAARGSPTQQRECLVRGLPSTVWAGRWACMGGAGCHAAAGTEEGLRKRPHHHC
jgi:hypothetical protein